MIDDAVLLYLTQHAPGLKNFRDLQGALALMLPAYTGQPMSQLTTVARAYATAQAGKISAATIHNRRAYLRAACGRRSAPCPSARPTQTQGHSENRRGAG